ncbi:hypothetical protein RB195_023770 [Necator americanus]|uniref:Uncharacterized protein n=1 Tax=Necator americanus TaxID=51031 RepID=A0ABR1EKN8_NECAM
MDVYEVAKSTRRICAVDEAALCEAYQRCTMCCWNKQAIPCTSRGSSGFIRLTSAVHTVHGHDNEGNPEAASVDSTLCRRCHALWGLEMIFRNKYSLGRISCSNMDCASTHQKLSTWSADQG